ncbi:MAG: Nif3-like dinuclear metal center hexameric protein [Aliidiomarina sp.]|uniref:Nif3-like dinuclear metal center hexameric protein n=1 Tax=Aliidiomarina sp. TaxID=1872439 RepID=UPI0025BE06EE|nr:Nif3-like dinuclear metal center hexameric protein [Aliidiomarina sp.]MCH8500360.1 Nif3-like dinuclear metal center hexameric protein [Aliidiomarina sp.]
MQRAALLAQLNEWLQPDMVQDYCPNGLQVQGRDVIERIVTGVTASQALLDAAVEVQADTVIVHHGYFWKGEPEAVVGMKYRRLRTLFAHDMNLIAYHLPLDIHPEFGNNRCLLQLLNCSDIQAVEAVKPQGILQLGTFADALSGYELADRIEYALARTLVACELNEQPISRIAVCTGGGQGFIEQALAAGADAFITGEVSEQTIHVARECGIQFFAAGHHATERYGVQALGDKIASQFNLDVQFIDIDNPA